VRTALRMGAEEAMIVYRRSDKEMSARVEEYHHAIEEGVQFHWLTNPLEIIDDGSGWVGGLSRGYLPLPADIGIQHRRRNRLRLMHRASHPPSRG
jgi:NADPH-dependent glutamate synthase beta subunit-like oxidoreductase